MVASELFCNVLIPRNVCAKDKDDYRFLVELSVMQAFVSLRGFYGDEP